MAYGARWQWTPAGLVGNAEFWSHSGPTLRSMGVDAVFGWCDGCGKERLDVRSCGRDSAGDPDSPDFCTTCRMNERHRAFGHRCARRRVAVK